MHIDADHKAKQNKTKGTGLKILTPKEMLQRLPIALAQVKAGNNPENLSNEIRQAVYSLYQSKEITKKVYNNIIKSIQQRKILFNYISTMNTIFINSENGKTSKAHLEITEVVVVHCNIVNNDYQQESRVLYTFAPNKPFGSLLEISPTNHLFLTTFNSKYQNIEVWLTDEKSQPLEIEDIINLTLVIT